jgi:uncharacterized protein (DUF1015 family)
VAVVIPFRGLLYNPEKVGDPGAVMAPPYDVITPEFQETLYKRHPNNIVRLILGKTTPKDRPGSDRYSRGAEELKSWINEGVMARDEAPAVYYYTQDYTIKKGRRRTRKGFIALARLEEFGKGGILPHERTLSGPKKDRLNLMKACCANLSSIFSLYQEPEVKKEDKINSILEAAAEGEPVIEVTGDDDVVNRLWRINDTDVILRVTRLMDSKTLFIADGHHRYETALNYRNMMNERLKNPTGEEPFNYVMMYFSSMDGEGLDIFPTHRVIHSLRGFEGETFLEICQEYFDLEELAFDYDTEGGVREEFLKRMEDEAFELTRFGLYIKGKKSYFILKLKTKKIMDDIFGDTIPDVYKALDVTVLHSLVFKSILGITPEDQESEKNLVYVKGFDEALEAGREGKGQMVFFMNPTKVEQIKAASEAGLLMPQKSTYFYPKLLSGLVINLLC